MKHLKYILLLLGLSLAILPASVSAETGPSKQEEVDMKQIIFEHLEDSYEWHITGWKGKHIAIPLPVIVHGENGWSVFMSSHLAHGHAYEGFYIAPDGKYQGKIVENLPDGTQHRPFDISITKTAAAVMLNCILLLAIVLGVARWYGRRPRHSVPRGFVGACEMFIMSVEDEVVRKCIGKDYKRYSPYLLTAFFFIFLSNLMGLIPVFPGGANTTGNIAVTMVLALFTFFAVNLFGNREYWKDIFWPHVPTWMKVPIPLMPLIELFGVLSKPFALMIRLFANIMAGHTVILALTGLIFITYSMGTAINTGMTVFSVLLSIFMNMLELLVAYIQAYVFTMLSAVFIGLSRQEELPVEMQAEKEGRIEQLENKQEQSIN